MDRLAAGVLIAGVVLALNAGMLREALADAGPRRDGQPALPPASAVPSALRATSVMSLMVCLSALTASNSEDNTAGA